MTSLVCAGDAPLLFEKKLKKPITSLYTIGESGDKLFLHNKAKLFMMDGNTGKTIWEAEVPKFTEDGLNMVWNSKLYIASMKKGMMAFNLDNGSVAWETDTKLKMKSFWGSYDFATGFVLFFDKDFKGFDPNTGAVKYTQENYDISDKLWEAGLATIYSFERDFGGRLLLLGNKNVQVFNADTGELLGTSPVTFNGKEGIDPVIEVTDELAVVFSKDATIGININTGQETWRLEKGIDPDYGIEQIEYNDGQYLLMNYKKGFITVDLLAGKIMWETGENAEVLPFYHEIFDDGTLAMIAFKSKAIGLGTAFFAYGFDFMTGEIKYGPLPIIWSGMASAFGQMQAAIHPVDIIGDEIILLTFGAGAYKIDDDPSQKYGMVVKGKHPNGSEGFVRYNMRTGELKYRTDLKVYDNWNKNRPNAAYGANDPGSYMNTDVFPKPVLDGEGNAFIIAEPGVVKVNLETGETLWTSPDYGHTGYLTYVDGKLAGTIGYAQFRWVTEGQKAKDATLKSKKHGFFILDAETGEEIWTYPGKIKKALGHHLTYFDEATKAYYLSDGETLQRINIDNPGIAWKLDFKKDLTGRLNAENSIAFILTGVSGYTTSTHIHTEKTYSIQHGLYVDWIGDGKMMVRGPNGPAMVDLDGKVLYKGEWDWDPGKMSLIPTRTPGGLLYQFKNKLRMISIEDGKELWESKEKYPKDADMSFSEDMSKLFIYGQKTISCYKIK